MLGSSCEAEKRPPYVPYTTLSTDYHSHCATQACRLAQKLPRPALRNHTQPRHKKGRPVQYPRDKR
eukprot:9244770-Prorocentrum_lima.AAC.1